MHAGSLKGGLRLNEPLNGSNGHVNLQLRAIKRWMSQSIGWNQRFCAQNSSPCVGRATTVLSSCAWRRDLLSQETKATDFRDHATIALHAGRLDSHSAHLSHRLVFRPDCAACG